jgi:hypothetical protein
MTTIKSLFDSQEKCLKFNWAMIILIILINMGTQLNMRYNKIITESL